MQILQTIKILKDNEGRIDWAYPDSIEDAYA